MILTEKLQSIVLKIIFLFKTLNYARFDNLISSLNGDIPNICFGMFFTNSITNSIMETFMKQTTNKSANHFEKISYKITFGGWLVFLVLISLNVNSQNIKTVAGNGIPGYSGDGGSAINAGLFYPQGVAVDASGNIFISDYYNNRIRKVSTSGIITTVAGTGTGGYSGDGGLATSANLLLPQGVAVDGSGNIYIADYYNNRIRKVSTSGIITTVAGSGTGGYGGDGGTATSANLNLPQGVAVDASGNIYIADNGNNRVRKVSPSGIISTIAGNGTGGFSGDGSAATSAKLNSPAGVAVDGSGNIYIADYNNNRIRKVNSSGIISTIAGNGTGGFSGDGGASVNAQLFNPRSVALDGMANVYIADYNNSRIRLALACVSGSYVGTTGGDANSAINWCGGLPTSATNVIVSTAIPKLTGNLSVNSLALTSGINLNGFGLTINGAITGTGNITGSPTSNLTINGNATGSLYFDATTANSTNTLNNITINTSGTITLGNTLFVKGSVTPTAGTLTTNGNLILLSDANGTARIDQVSGTISGDITVQRYIPSKASRKYSFIGSPINQSVRNSWQQQIYVSGYGTGGVTCGTTTGDGGSTDKYNSNGFDVTQKNAPTIYNYVATPVNGSRYVGIANTKQTNLSPGTGYCVNIRGNRNSALVSCYNQLATNSPTSPESVTLSETGTITYGDVTVALNNPSIHKYTLLANPYPCQISYTAFQASNSVINNKMWTYSPFGNGNYTTFSAGIITNGATGYDGTIGERIAIGQAFFVQANSAGNVVFHESHKVSGAIPNTQYFGNGSNKHVRIGLKTVSNDPLDEVVVRFNKEGAREYVEAWDAESLNSGNQVLSIIKPAKILAIATLPDSLISDTLKLNVGSNSTGNFRLTFIEYEGIDTSMRIVLLDNFTGVKQDVKIIPNYDFNVTNDTGSKGSNRFGLLLSHLTPLPISITEISSVLNPNGIEIKWGVKDESNISSYNLERSKNGASFTFIDSKKAANKSNYSIVDAQLPREAPFLYYRIKVVGADGAIKYSSVLKIKIDNPEPTKIFLHPNPVKNDLNIKLDNASSGRYDLRILTSIGKTVMTKPSCSVVCGGLTLDVSKLPKGIYILELTGLGLGIIKDVTFAKE